MVCVYVCAFRGRDRYVNEEFDLDLTYITERIIGKPLARYGHIRVLIYMYMMLYIIIQLIGDEWPEIRVCLFKWKSVLS